jgi:hypothetical protein
MRPSKRKRRLTIGSLGLIIALIAISLAVYRELPPPPCGGQSGLSLLVYGRRCTDCHSDLRLASGFKGVSALGPNTEPACPDGRVMGANCVLCHAALR